MPGDPYHLPKCPTCGRGKNIYNSRGWRCSFCYNFVFRIRKRYFDMIMNGVKTVEYRRASEFWRKRVLESNTGKYGKIVAIFICGKEKHIEEIEHIKRIKTPSYFSKQGKQDVNTPECYAFYLKPNSFGEKQKNV